MKIKKLNIHDAFEFNFPINKDHRGLFFRTFCKKTFKELKTDFSPVQQSICYNLKKGTVRGMHWQTGRGSERKIVRSINGSVYDVIIDMRKNSKTFLKWDAVILSEKKKNALYVPPNCAHGYMTLEKNSNLIYLIDNYFDKQTTRMFYRDETLKIKWPKIKKITIAESDQNAPGLKDLKF